MLDSKIACSIVSSCVTSLLSHSHVAYLLEGTNNRPHRILLSALLYERSVEHLSVKSSYEVKPHTLLSCFFAKINTWIPLRNPSWWRTALKSSCFYEAVVIRRVVDPYKYIAVLHERPLYSPVWLRPTATEINGLESDIPASIDFKLMANQAYDGRYIFYIGHQMRAQESRLASIVKVAKEDAAMAWKGAK